MIHVIQWQSLGTRTDLKTDAEGLERFGYENSPLEKMAYEAEAIYSSVGARYLTRSDPAQRNFSDCWSLDQ